MAPHPFGLAHPLFLGRRFPLGPIRSTMVL